MGKKQNQAHRTKGNTRPSSSARAAQQLQSSGQGVGFIGFGALSGDLGYVPTSQGNEEADSSVDGDFRMVLRKLSKRDTVTKLKALQELTVLFKEKDVDSVKSVLPFWPRIYSKISVDNDRRVREGLQETFEALVLRVRRGLAPHLKALMGCWLVAQNDVYAPAASASRAVFQAAFPPAKQTEAIVFCKEEITEHIHENLLNQTPTSFSDPKTTEPKDMEDKYQKIVSATLQAWRALLATLTPEQVAELRDSFSTMLSDNKLWKHAKSENSMIKGSFYSFISGLCQYNPEVARQYGEKISPLVLHNLDNTDPVVCGFLWESVLFTITTIQDCWKYVTPRKGVWPKLWSLLQQGGGGSATAIYPSMLPLLSQIPEDVIGEHLKFYQEFFRNFREGLILERTTVSRSETAAVITALLECLRFCLVHHLDESNESRQIREFLVLDQLLPILEASIVDKSGALSASPLYAGVVDLLNYIHKLSYGQGSVDGGTNKAQVASQVLTSFWLSLSNMLKSHVESCEASHAYVLERTASLLITFKYPMGVQKKKKTRVRFSESGEGFKSSSPRGHQRIGSGGMGAGTKSSMLKKTSREAGDEEGSDDTGVFLQADGPLMDLVCQTCHIAHDQFHQKQSVIHLKFVSSTFTAFLGPRLLADMYRVSKTEELEEASDAMVLKFCQGILIPWMTEPVSVKEVDRITVYSSLIEMTVALIGSASSKTQLLSLLLQKLDVHLLVLLSRHLLQLRPVNPVIVKWFRGEEFGELVASVAKELCQASLEPTAADHTKTKTMWELLTLALGTGDNLESVVGEDYVDLILTEMRVSLPSPARQKELTAEEINRCVTFVCDVATNFYSNIKGCLLVKSAEALLAALFNFSCQNYSSISVQLRSSVYDAWQLGIRALLAQREGLLTDEFLNQVTTQLKNQVVQDATTYESLNRIGVQSLPDDRLGLLGTMAIRLCQTIAMELTDASEPNLHDPNVVALCSQLYLPYKHDATTEWSSCYLVNGQVTFAAIPTGHTPSSVDAIPKAIAPIAFTAKLLVATGLSQPTEAVDSNLPMDVTSQCEVWTSECGLLHDIACGTAFCQAVLGKRREALKGSEMGQLTQHLEESFATLMKHVPECRRIDLIQLAVNRSIKDGHLWAFCLGLILEQAQTLKWSTNLATFLQPTERLNHLDEASLQTFQVALKHLPLAEVRSLVEVIAAQVITCPVDNLVQIQGGWGHLAVLVTALSVLSGPTGAADGGEAALPADVVISVLDELRVWRDEHDRLFAFDKTLSSLSWPEMGFNIAVMHLLQQVITLVPTQLTATHWDFTLCSLVAWVQACSEATQTAPSTLSLPVQAFMVATSHLLATVAACMKHVVPVEQNAFPPNLITEWKEFFTEGSYGLMLPLFIRFAETLPLVNPSAVEDQLLRSISSAVGLCPAEHIRNHKLPAHLVADQESTLPDDLQTLLNHLCPLLLASHRAIHVTGYRLLLAIMPQLAAFDVNVTCEDDDQKEEVSRSPPVALMTVLETSGAAMKELLHGLRPGDPIFVPSHTEECTVAMAYLLSWKLTLAFFRAAPSELRAQYALFLRGPVESLLTTLFHLMPEIPLIPLRDSLTANAPNQKLANTSNMFAEQPLLDPSGIGSSQEVQHLACSVYQQALQDVPAMVRTWWVSQDRHTATIVSKFTTNYVSPLLIATEMGAIRQQQLSLDNMTITVRQAAREVAATYSVEDFTMEVVVRLPSNHPLGVINIETGKRIGVANNQWRNWMLQMVTFLTHQNGSIVEGLMLWKRNVDKRFEGVDDCMICYSVIHGSNYQLPRLLCKVCKKKFHSACLYKWFNTSNNSTCPMCRNLF